MLTAEDKKIVLVVDDAPANIQVAQSILKDEYKIHESPTSGAKASELQKVGNRCRISCTAGFRDDA